MKLVHVFQNMKPPNVIYKQRSTIVILESCKKPNFLVSFHETSISMQKSCIIFEFCFYINETKWKFSAPLHRNRLRCNNFLTVFLLSWNFLQFFHSFIFYSAVSFFCETSFKFHIFFHFFFRKNTSFWPVFVKKWGFSFAV